MNSMIVIKYNNGDVSKDGFIDVWSRIWKSGDLFLNSRYFLFKNLSRYLPSRNR